MVPVRVFVAMVAAAAAALTGTVAAAPVYATSNEGAVAPAAPTRMASARKPPPSERAKAPSVPLVQTFTPVSRATQQANGKTKVELFSRPAFRRTAAGWKPVSGKITTAKGAFPVRAAEAVRPVWFGTSADALVQIRLPQGAATFSLPGARIKAPKVTQGKGNHFVTYRDVAADTDLSYDVHGSQVKEKLILKSPKAPTSFTFHLSDRDGLLGAPTRGAYGSYTFANPVADGTTLGIAAPQAWEQDRPVALPGSAHQQVTPSGDGYDITLRVDKSWMKGKTFPIVLDPTLEYTYSDGTLASAYAPIGATACNGDPCTLSSTEYGDYVLGKDDTLGATRAYFQVDLSNIPAETVIASGQFAQGLDYTWTAKEDLHATTSLLGPGSTGVDLANATDPQVLGTIGGGYGGGYGNTEIVDITKKIRSWVGNGTGGGLTLKLADEQVPSDPYLSTTFTAPSVVIEYLGAPLPPPIPVEQTFGCDCRWVHGAGVVGQRLDPVNTAAGAQIETTTDIPAAAAPGIALDLTRTFNGLDTRVGPLGAGWSMGFDAALEVDPGTGDITFRDATGGRSKYTKQLDGTYLGDPGVTATLTGDQTLGWSLSALSGESLTFDTLGRPKTDRDEAGKGVTYTYRTDGRLSRVTDSLGRYLTFTWGINNAANGRLVRVNTDDGRQVRYQYTDIASAPRLTKVYDLNNVATTITYAADGTLTGIKDGNGKTAARNVYDPVTGRITQQTDAAGRTWNLAWDDATQTQTITDPRGAVTQDVYYGNVLTKHIAADGGETSYYYDGNLNLTGVMDPRGNLTRMTYDAAGNMLSRIAPAPFNTTETWAYDGQNRPTSYADQDGHTTAYSYTAQGRLATVQDDSGTTGYQYDTKGQLTATTDRNGQETTYGFNTVGDLTSITNPLGNTTTMGYDTAHRLVSHTDPRGNVAGCACASTYTTSYTHDGAGRVLTETDPLGRTTTYTYDNVGNRKTVADPTGATTTYTYTATNLPATITDALAHKTTNSYDTTGNLTATTDPLGRKTSHTYDLAGRMITTRAPAGNATGVTTAVRNANTVTYTYDLAGNQTQTSTPNPGGGTIKTTTTYDELNRPATVTDPTGGATTYSYDALGRVSAVTDPTGATTTQDHDWAGRVTATTTPTGETTTFSYDPEGRLTDQSTPTARAVYTYDAAGRRTSMGDQRSVYCYCNNYTTTFDYDPAGNLTTTTDPLGHQIKAGYDAAGQRTSITNGNDGSTGYTYDDTGRLATVTSPEDESTGYIYDATGNLIARTDPRHNTTTLTYDASRRLTGVNTPEGHQWAYGYDLNGNRTTATLPSGTATTTSGDGTISTSYDPLGRPTARAFSDGTASLGFTYDKAGRLLTATDGLTATQGATSYTYDPAGRMLTRSRNNQTFTYGYDAAGRLTSRAYPDGTTIENTYAGGRLSRQSWDGQSVDYGYDLADQLTSIARSNGTTTTLEYDNASRLISSTTFDASDVLVAAQQTLDAAGNPLAVTTTRPSGSEQATYGYDDDGRITSVCYTSAPCTSGITYQYDANSNRTRTERTGLPQPGTRIFSYDTDDRLQSATDSAGTTTATWTTNPDGQTTAQTVDGDASTFGYNLAGQLTAASTPTGTTSYSYDAAGNRASATTGADTTRYTWDENAPLPALATETSNSQTATYVHGPTGPLDRRTATGDTWYISDLHANIADLTDQTGAAVGEYRYEPFGQLRDATGTASGANPLRFDGQYLDAASGLYNNRARQYDPTLGRFTSLDPKPAALEDPHINAYSYGANRPLVLDDPSGQCLVLCGAIIGAVVGGTIGAASYAITHQGDDFSWGDLGKSAGVGALTGAVAGATMGLATPAISGALGGGLAADVAAGWAGGALGSVYGSTAASLVTGNGLPSPGDLVESAAYGGLGGAGGAAAGPAVGALCRTFGRTAANSAPAAAANGARVFRSGGAGAGGGGISLEQAAAAASRNGIDMRMMQLAHEAGGPGYGFTSYTMSGAPFRAGNGGFLVTLTDRGLASEADAVNTIAHELNHLREAMRTGMPIVEEGPAIRSGNLAEEFFR